MARRIIHCCLDIEGGIRHAKDLKGCITVDGRTLMTANEVKSFLREQLAMGRRVLPMGDCDNFDYQTGCKGHVVEEDWQWLIISSAKRHSQLSAKDVPRAGKELRR